ncbi:Glycoside hydrolase family 18, catalytic domain containing protein [Candidatus Nanopelagicaceae bacterium]
MKRIIAFALSLITIATLTTHITTAQLASAADKPPRKVITGWLPYYSVRTIMPLVRKLPTAQPTVAGKPAVCDATQYGPVENQAIETSYLFTNKDLMKEVMPFWFSIKSPTVIRNDYVTGNPSWPMADTVCLIRRAGLQVIPTMTDGTEKLVLSGYLGNAATRTTIVKTIVDLVLTNDFDGIDLDYEGFAFVDGNTTWTKTAPRWVAFIKELSFAMRSHNKLLSISTPYVYDPKEKQKGYFVYAWADIANYIDRLRIMTYDYSVAKPGPIGPISWTEKTLKYAISIMSPSKVYIGLPGYGRDWITSVNGKCPVSAPPGLIGGAKAATFKTSYATTKAAIDKATPIFDEKFSEATYSYTQIYNGLSAAGASTECSVNRTVWYQNSRSYAERMALVAKYRLGGAALWTLAMEDPAATTELRNAALAIAPDPVVSTLSIEGAPQNTINYAGLFTVKGLLTLKDKTPIAGLTVSLEIKRANESSWSKVTELVTGVDGTISTPMTLGADASLRLTTVGTWEQAESVSPESTIKVKSSIQLDRPVSVSKGSPIVIKAQLLPRVAGKSAQLQKNVNGKWQNVGAAVISDANGLFTFTTVEAKRGVITMRVQLVGDIASEQFAIVIR